MKSSSMGFGEVFPQNIFPTRNSGMYLLVKCTVQTYLFAGRPLLSKLSLYAVYLSTLEAFSLPLPPCVPPFTRISFQQYLLSREHRSTFPGYVEFSHLIDSESSTYYAVKQSVVHYQHAKHALLGPSAPFAGWICSGRQWEGFDCQGALSAVPVSVAEDLTVVAENEAQVVS